MRRSALHRGRFNRQLVETPETMPELPSIKLTDHRSLFKPEYIHIAKTMMEKGMKYTDLAQAFRVNRHTIKKWMDDYPEFKEAIIQAQDYFNSEIIEKALVRRAAGYSFIEDTEEYKEVSRKIFDLETGDELSENEFTKLIKTLGKRKATASVRIEPIMGMVLTRRVKKNVAPSERAIEYFLNNRSQMITDDNGIRPRWSPMNKIELTGKDGKDFVPDSISPEKLLAEMLMAQRKKEDEVIEAEFEESKRLGITVGEENYREEKPPR